MSGWVLIHRDVWLSDGFEDEPFSQREAWIWIIAHAAWKDTTQRFKGADRHHQEGAIVLLDPQSRRHLEVVQK